METIGIIALVVVVALVVGYALKGRYTASPDDPERGVPERRRGGHDDTVDRPADAGAEGMIAPDGQINTGPEDRRST